jgi:Sec-independent protein translocase protein TatA
MLRVILWILLAYFLYRFVFGFLLPIFKVGRQMKRQVRDFQSQMNEAQQNYQHNHQQQAAPQQHAKPSNQKSGDYIDFEEIK